MTFFNKKTDVIDIELTPYGRYLLSIGRLKPVFYEFVDDDILYDTAATNNGRKTEEQHEAHDRITKNTPKLKTRYLKTGVETDSPENYDIAVDASSRDYTNIDPDLRFNVSVDSIREEKEHSTHNQKGVYAMGRSSYSSDKLPSFQVTMLQGELTGSAGFMKVSSSIDTTPAEERLQPALPIPQIDLDLIVVATTGSALTDNPSNESFSSAIFDDGTFVKLSFTEPIIHLKEFNSFYEKENFEIEFFHMTTASFNNGDSVQTFNPLKFHKKASFIQNDMLLDDINERPKEGDPTRDFVNYFFSVSIDDEIPVEELCEAVDTLEINNQFLDEELICPDQRTERFNIYSTRVDPSDLEDCD